MLRLRAIKQPGSLHRVRWCTPARLAILRSVATTSDSENDQRQRLTTELKNAMKSKDTFASTVLRSVLAEVYSADKSPSGPISNSQVTSIVRKAIARRADAAGKYAVASRHELVESEMREARFLGTLLPPSMSETETDDLLRKIAEEEKLLDPGIDSKRAMGILLKTFYTQVDKALVDSKAVKERAHALLDSR